MQTKHLLPLAVLSVALSVQAAQFNDIRLDADGTKLTVLQVDGKRFTAPKDDDQDSFAKPSISVDHRHVGWLALFPNQGASYSQPLYLVVFDSSGRVQRFSGDFGMVFGWCFVKGSDAVVYQYQLPHGTTPVGFDMRRLKDGKLLHHALLSPTKPDENEPQVAPTKAPPWADCAQKSAAAE
jgi:hypothetical protein